jgi:hypothetical protein
MAVHPALGLWICTKTISADMKLYFSLVTVTRAYHIITNYKINALCGVYYNLSAVHCFIYSGLLDS